MQRLISIRNTEVKVRKVGSLSIQKGMTLNNLNLL